MNEPYTHLAEVDGREFHLELIGDEIVVSDFGKKEREMYDALTKPSAETVRNFMRPVEPLFSFAATPEMRALIIAADDWFEKRGDANGWMCGRLDELAAPYVREYIQRQAGGAQ